MKIQLPALLFLCVTIPSPAWAQYSGPALAPEGWVTGVMPAAEKEQEVRIENGLFFLEEGFFKSALRELRAAYKLKPETRIRFLIGKTLYMLQRFVEAEIELRAYLAEAGKKVPEDVQAEVETILADIPNHVGLVTFECEVDGARVFIDMRRAATLPIAQPIRVNAGIHLIEVQADGYQTSYKKVRIPGGKGGTYKIVLAESQEPESEQPFTPLPNLALAGKYKEIGNGLVMVGGLFLGGGLVITPIGAVLASMNVEKSTVRTGYVQLAIGGGLLLASMPMLIAGTHFKLKGFVIENGDHEVSLAPYVTGMPGGAMAGVGGFF